MKEHGKQAVIYFLLVVVGILAGVGGMHVTTVGKVSQHDIKIDIMQSDIGRAFDAHQSTLELITQVVNQNNLLIQEIIASKP